MSSTQGLGFLPSSWYLDHSGKRGDPKLTDTKFCHHPGRMGTKHAVGQQEYKNNFLFWARGLGSHQVAL